MLRYFVSGLVLMAIMIFKKSSTDSIVNFSLNFFNIKIRVHGKENLKNYDNLDIVIMANHLNGVDFGVIYHAIKYYTNKKIYTIVKHNVLGDKTDKSMVSNMLALFRNQTYDKLNFLPYVRNNKESGEIIKNKMLDIIKNKKHTIMLFPEGKPTRKGVPSELKSGSFRLCADNNIHVLPVTIKFDKPIGIDTKDPVDLSKWFNLVADIYIHKPIYNEDWFELKNQVLYRIKKPLTA
jgi:1-acyl-sn-glycerol-3-phosphate acyltransferase